MRERRLRKYLGDYTLFMSGFFRSHVESGGYLDYYLKEGSRLLEGVGSGSVALPDRVPALRSFPEKFEYFSGALDYMHKAYFAASSEKDPFAGFSEADRRVGEGERTDN